jgi:WD40 repeat protein
MNKLFLPENAMDIQTDREEKKEYILFIAERTPWFVGDIILCLIYMPNINMIASGSFDKKIRLWDLRTGKADTRKKDQSDKRHKSIKEYFDFGKEADL